MHFALAGLLGLLALGGDEGDRVVLKSGKELRGRVVFQDASKVVLRQDRRDNALERAEVETVDSRRENLAALLDNDAKWRPLDRGKVELLFAQAQETGLLGEGQVFAWHLLMGEHGNEAANAFLGHKKRAHGWALPVGARWVDWDKRFELAKDWGSAWELSSLHYQLRSNLSLPVDLDVLLDVERLYRAFYDTFGNELGLYDVCHPMALQLHADAASYAEMSSEVGNYAPETDVLSLKADAGLNFGTLAHELTHQLLQDTAFRERNDEGSIPPWLNEGLAEYMAASVQSSAPLVFVAGRPQASHFLAHSSAKNPFDLSRVLNLSGGDYEVKSDSALKYAESYTLVHFLLHGLKGRHRAGFFEYLRLVYAGKGSSTDLKNALGVEWSQLEKDWNAYARIPH